MTPEEIGPAVSPPKSRTGSFAPRQNNLALRGIEADFGPEHADTFRRDLHPDLRADYVIEGDLVDCMVALPGQLFYSTQIPVCLWFGRKNNALESANDAGLFDGESELSLLA